MGNLEKIGDEKENGKLMDNFCNCVSGNLGEDIFYSYQGDGVKREWTYPQWNGLIQPESYSPVRGWTTSALGRLNLQGRHQWNPTDDDAY